MRSFDIETTPESKIFRPEAILSAFDDLDWLTRMNICYGAYAMRDDPEYARPTGQWPVNSVPGSFCGAWPSPAVHQTIHRTTGTTARIETAAARLDEAVRGCLMSHS